MVSFYLKLRCRWKNSETIDRIDYSILPVLEDQFPFSG
jgi:hypothetical protein